MHIFNKYVYGEKPLRAKGKPRRGDFANVALNSYEYNMDEIKWEELIH